MKNELELRTLWFAEAEKQTVDTLGEWVKSLATHEHDYGTICRAAAAAAIGAVHAVNSSPNGGITGFQAGCIMWDFIDGWMKLEGPKRLVSYEEMLYPQYAYKFGKTISKDTWEYLQNKAREKLNDLNTQHASQTVIEHWRSIAEGKMPFGYEIEKGDK